MLSETLAADEEIKRWRSQFSVPSYIAYLNHASQSPLPFCVCSAVDRAMREAAAGADALWMNRLAECERVRDSAATLLGARRPDQVAFVPNTSTGLSYVAEGLDWRQGDNVVIAESEFPSNVYPWLGLADRGVEVRTVAEADGAVPADAIARAITPATRVVAISWVQYATGYRVDLAAVGRQCRDRDILLVVDAVQGLGALPFSATDMDVDVCVAGAHKWMLGGEGIGLFYVSDRALERIRPVIRGWLSVRDVFGPVSDPPNYKDGAARFECGTSNIAGIYGLGAAINWLLEIGINTIQKRVLRLACRAEVGLFRMDFELAAPRTPGFESGLVCAKHPVLSAKELCEGLFKRDVEVAHRRGQLRIAPHFYNTEEEIDRCLDGIAELL